MSSANSLVADAERFREMCASEQVVDYLEDRFRSYGATHFLATGVPLPGRPIEPLVLRCNWGEARGDRNAELQVASDDPVFRQALAARGAFRMIAPPPEADAGGISVLARLIGHAKAVRLVGVPIQAFHPYQACVVAAGPSLSLDPGAMLVIDHFCSAAFGRLIALGVVKPDRPGDLSARERRVVELSARQDRERDRRASCDFPAHGSRPSAERRRQAPRRQQDAHRRRGAALRADLGLAVGPHRNWLRPGIARTISSIA
jgi:LuxR family quorum sensing-dependent transcriptional regulator